MDVRGVHVEDEREGAVKLVKQDADYGHKVDYILVSHSSGEKVRHMARLDKQAPRDEVAGEIRRMRREIRALERQLGRER